MKTSIDLPDELYRQVKARSALEGKTVREVATALFGAYAAGEAPAASRDTDAERAEREAWLARFQAWGEQLSAEHPGGGFVNQLMRDRR